MRGDAVREMGLQGNMKMKDLAPLLLP